MGWALKSPTSTSLRCGCRAAPRRRRSRARGWCARAPCARRRCVQRASKSTPRRSAARRTTRGCPASSRSRASTESFHPADRRSRCRAGRGGPPSHAPPAAARGARSPDTHRGSRPARAPGSLHRWCWGVDLLQADDVGIEIGDGAREALRRRDHRGCATPSILGEHHDGVRRSRLHRTDATRLRVADRCVCTESGAGKRKASSWLFRRRRPLGAFGEPSEITWAISSCEARRDAGAWRGRRVT